MRAINLIPASARGASRSSGGPFVLLAALALLLIGVTLHVLTGNTIAERRDELATVRTQVQAAQVQVEARRPYVAFAALAQARVLTVRQLGAARFDWEDALADLSKVIPGNVWLQSLLGTVTTGVSVEGGAGNASGLRSASSNPAIELSGCTESHEDVARLISRLRLMDGVQRVSLSDSTKEDGGGGGCAGFPLFNLVIFFDPLPTVAAPASRVSHSSVLLGTRASRRTFVVRAAAGTVAHSSTRCATCSVHSTGPTSSGWAFTWQAGSRATASAEPAWPLSAGMLVPSASGAGAGLAPSFATSSANCFW